MEKVVTGKRRKKNSKRREEESNALKNETMQQVAVQVAADNKGRKIDTSRREEVVDCSSRKRRRSISGSSLEIIILGDDGREASSNLSSDVRTSTEPNNNQSKSTVNIPDIEGENVAVRVKERLARMEEKLKAGEGDEALRVKVKMVKEKLLRFSFLTKVKMEIDRKQILRSTGLPE